MIPCWSLKDDGGARSISQRFDPNGCTGMGVPVLASFFGTSLSAQVFAGIANLIENAVGEPVGNLDPTIYALAYNDQAGSGFRDVKTGNNDFNA